jgi:hypothetical protein
MITNKAHRIRLKISGGIDHIQKFYETVEKFAEFEGFAITYTKTKQRFNTVLWDMNVELSEIGEGKS